MLDPLTACISIIEDYNAATATRFAAARSAETPVSSSKGKQSRNSRHDPRARKARQVAKASALAARIEAVR